MNTAIIMLGSNINAKKNLEIAINKLTGSFEITGRSIQLMTEPIGVQGSMNFQNMALKIITNKLYDDAVCIFKQIEKEMGRESMNKPATKIPIDIDLIFWNDRLIHEDYNRYEYVKKCVNEIR